MASKKTTGNKTTSSGDLPALRIGSRVRFIQDGAEGRIVWANGTAVKIKWADGEQVTWKRDELADKGVQIVDADDAAEPEPAVRTMPPVEPPTPEPPPVEQAEPTPAGQAPAEQVPPVEQVATEQAAVVEPAPAKKRRARKANADASKVKKLSALDAAAKVLAEEGRPMTCKEMIDAMAVKSYWSSPGGKTPEATLYSAVLREVATKGTDARFVKTDRGKFGLKS